MKKSRFNEQVRIISVRAQRRQQDLVDYYFILRKTVRTPFHSLVR